MSSSTASLPPVASTSQLQQQGHDQATSTTPPSSSTFHLLPPSLREILDAFAQNGGGDRELLLAILGAKRAEEDRLASSLSLQTQLFLLQSQHQHQQPFHMIPQLQLPLPPPRRNQLDDAPPSPSSLSSSSSSSSGPSTPPPSHSLPEMDSSIGPIRSAKLSLVRAKLLARKEAKQQQQQPQRWSNASSVSPPPPRSPHRSATPRSMESEVARRSPEATRVALSGLMGVTGSLGVVASSVRPKESWVRGGGSGDEEDQEMEMEEVVRVKLESQE